jgi:predicted RNase H-like nuclease (RuvC/YqgF family)
MIDKSNPFFDIDSYINHLVKTVEQQKYTIDSLKNEIRTQRKEIGALREERRKLLDNDRPPMFDEPLWTEPNQENMENINEG